MAATDARPVPRKNAAFRFYFAIRKPSDSTLITTWTGADSEVSLDGGAFADCTNESTEIGTTGCGYIDLTAAEMNADAVILKVTVTNTGAVPLVFTLFPEEAGDYRADVVQFGGANITAASGIPEVKVASIATDAVNAAALAANAVTEIQSGLATSTNVTDAQTAIIAQIDANETKIDSIQSDTNDIQSRLPAALEGGRIAAALDSSTQTQVNNIENAAGYLLALQAGAISNPQTATETYAITTFGSTFTVALAGLTSTGTRAAPTLTKT